MPEDIVQITSFSPIFKGLGLIVLGSFALLFAYWMDKKWKEPRSFWFNIFIGLAAFIVLYGLFILVARPNWWALPY